MTKPTSLLKDSFIYGGSTIISKMMSWVLTVLFTYTMNKNDFGIMSNLYAYSALVIVILTFGTETGFFYFANQTNKYKLSVVYSTTLILIEGFIVVFLICFLSFLHFVNISIRLEKSSNICVYLLVIILSLDALTAVPFAYLRHKKKTIKFAILKILNILLYTLICIFFLIICPKINKCHPSWITWFWNDNFKLKYIFIANLIATFISTLFLLPELTKFKYIFNVCLAKKILYYCSPLVFMGLIGVGNQVIDKLLFPLLYSGNSPMFEELGVYSACFKLSLIMMMFTQSFRYAYEPFFFEKSKEKNSKNLHANIMKHFIIIGILVFLIVTFYLDIIKYMIAPGYFVALKIVPIILIGDLCFAIYFNLSFWYKIINKTYWGAIFSTISFTIIFAINIIFIPKFSYIACAWASLVGEGLVMCLSYLIGQKYYPVKYDIKNISIYVILALILYLTSYFVFFKNIYFRILFNTFLISIYITIMLIKEFLHKKNIPNIFHHMFMLGNK